MGSSESSTKRKSPHTLYNISSVIKIRLPGIVQEKIFSVHLTEFSVLVKILHNLNTIPGLYKVQQNSAGADGGG